MARAVECGAVLHEDVFVVVERNRKDIDMDVKVIGDTNASASDTRQAAKDAKCRICCCFEWCEPTKTVILRSLRLCAELERYNVESYRQSCGTYSEHTWEASRTISQAVNAVARGEGFFDLSVDELAVIHGALNVVLALEIDVGSEPRTLVQLIDTIGQYSEHLRQHHRGDALWDGVAIIGTPTYLSGGVEGIDADIYKLRGCKLEEVAARLDQEIVGQLEDARAHLGQCHGTRQSNQTTLKPIMEQVLAAIERSSRRWVDARQDARSLHELFEVGSAIHNRVFLLDALLEVLPHARDEELLRRMRRALAPIKDMINWEACTTLALEVDMPDVEDK